MEDFIFGDADSGLIIDWTQMTTYNTITAVSAGAALYILAKLLKLIISGEKAINTDAWAMALGVPGFIMLITGAHLTLTWPWAKYFPFDNIIFGETSLAFGVLSMAAAIYLWRRGDKITSAANPAQYLAQAIAPIQIFIVGLGLALFGIAFAGIAFQLFAAPPAEPISGIFAAYPMIEATFLSSLFALIGLGAVLTPIAFKPLAENGTSGTGLQKTVTSVWSITGVIFLCFGAMNFYTHIGLIINTMGG